ncbi:PREDICTED: tRNA (adenine(58)-N(1))-methyltransferase non-catalytic subunit TRM6 isoform X1 [Papilio xuthus]|uniref:tRNA (adenine(58)-N(1))-methyltransferase non-catalytic subunit TRM6 n=1 Tax=Papilio xuthus TaxID=66420 RepID=A0AAJ7E838_PAPXU|nr:PREDICTED: tRNA (adenine(58)-N(1))-methyltransferase non-catalytic subunit TRM6 isoform X1 [Papilio xuthus]
MSRNFISIGDYIVIKKQNYKKLHKFNKTNSCVNIGRDNVNLNGIDGCEYFSVFRMLPRNKKNREYDLELSQETIDLKNEIDVKVSGTDNRNIFDDGRSQKLTPEEINDLRSDSSRASDIVETLITNSKTFHNKTGFSQEKYLRKKEKKYFEYIQILRPNLRMITEILYKLDPSKIQGIRMDTLSQIITLSNINSEGNHILYDSGSNGLLAAALLSAIGEQSTGKLIHMHPGNMSQKLALMGMNFSIEQLDRCVSVNVYSALRQFYQGCDTNSNDVLNKESIEGHNLKRKALENLNGHKNKVTKIEDDTDVKSNKSNVSDNDNEEYEPKKPKWHFLNITASKLLSEKADSLVIACKEDPQNIFNELSSFVKPGRPFVVYYNVAEPLQNLYMTLKSKGNVAALKLTCNWMRNYQILPERTHPEVTMDNGGGFLLSGYIFK